MTYEPRPGRAAFRALDYLETLPAVAEVLLSDIANAIEMAPNYQTDLSDRGMDK